MSREKSWTMPEWMRPYEGFIQTGGNGVEELMNDGSNVFINAPRAMMAVSVKAQVGMLTQLHQQGLLNESPKESA